MDTPATIAMPALKRTFARAEIALDPTPSFATQKMIAMLLANATHPTESARILSKQMDTLAMTTTPALTMTCALKEAAVEHQ